MQKKQRNALIILFLLICLGIFIRSCSDGSLLEKNMYWIARDSTFYPLDLRGREKNMVGFTNELMQAIANEEKFAYSFIDVHSNVILEGLQEKRYDAAISPLEPSIITEARYNFSDPFYLFGPVLVVKTNSDATDLEDMAGKLVGIESGFTQSEHLNMLPKGILLISYPHISDAFDSLVNNEIDGVIVDAIRGVVYTEGRFSGQLHVVTEPFSEKGLRVLTLKSQEGEQFIQRFNDGLKKVIRKNIFNSLVNKWSVISPERPVEKVGN